MAQTDAVEIIFRLLQRFAITSDGLSTPEIALGFDITRQTALKYIEHLQAAGIPIYDDGRRWYLDPDYRVPNYWSPTESEILRMMSRRLPPLPTTFRNGLQRS